MWWNWEFWSDFWKLYIFGAKSDRNSKNAETGKVNCPGPMCLVGNPLQLNQEICFRNGISVVIHRFWFPSSIPDRNRSLHNARLVITRCFFLLSSVCTIPRGLNSTNKGSKRCSRPVLSWTTIRSDIYWYKTRVGREKVNFVSTNWHVFTIWMMTTKVLVIRDSDFCQTSDQYGTNLPFLPLSTAFFIFPVEE